MGATAGMESMEDNHEEEFYRFMQDQNKRKQERERMRMLTYEQARTEGGTLNGAAGAVGDSVENSHALVPMQDYEADYADFADEVLNSRGNQEYGDSVTAEERARRKRARMLMKANAAENEEDDDKPEQLSIAEQMRRQ